jgi:hypothetical protein
MATDIRTANGSEQLTVDEKVSRLRELFADAPGVGRTALENVLQRLASDASQAPPPPVQSAGRVGSRLGKVSELTIIVPFAPGGAERLRAFLRLFGGNLAGADAVGSVHDMRFVFLDNDTRLKRLGEAVDEFLDKIESEERPGQPVGARALRLSPGAPG